MADTPAVNGSEDDKDWETIGTATHTQPENKKVVIDPVISANALLSEQVQLVNWWKNRALVLEQTLHDMKREFDQYRAAHEAQKAK